MERSVRSPASIITTASSTRWEERQRLRIGSDCSWFRGWATAAAATVRIRSILLPHSNSGSKKEKRRTKSSRLTARLERSIELVRSEEHTSELQSLTNL